MQSFPLTDPENPVLLCFFGHEMDARAYSDTELEKLFPEHRWRAPLPLRVVENHQQRWRYGCAFCVYRRGLAPQGGADRFASVNSVYFHLASWHG